MSWLGDFVGGIAGDFLGGVLGSSTGQSNAAYQVELQKDLAKYVNENKHQWEVSDLKAAGLNPILSANTSGFGNASAASVINANGSEGSQASALSSARSIAKMQNDTNLAINERNAGINEKNVDNEILNRDLSTKASVNYYNAQIEKLKQDMINSIAITAADVDYKNGMVEAAQSSAYAANKQAENAFDLNQALKASNFANADFTRNRSDYQKQLTKVFSAANAPYLSKYGNSAGYLDYGLGVVGDLANAFKPFASSRHKTDISYHWDK
ncbi:minor capsid protein [Capybara microvirus Cap3_SP_578]|nr:minor capsid protein [Capybara microvirus Cap3_SP_578]